MNTRQDLLHVLASMWCSPTSFTSVADRHRWSVRDDLMGIIEAKPFFRVHSSVGGRVDSPGFLILHNDVCDAVNEAAFPGTRRPRGIA